MPSSLRGRFAALLPLALLLVLSAPPSAALPACPAGALCFDALPSGSAVSAADLGAVSATDALVLSEADAALVLGVPTAGTFATSGDQGLLNTLQPSITFHLGGSATRFEVDVLALLDSVGGAISVVAEAFAGASLVASDASDPSLLGDSGLPEDVLLLTAVGGFDRVVLRPDLAVPLTTTFWLDTVRIRAVPEPGAALLVAAALGLAARCVRRAV